MSIWHKVWRDVVHHKTRTLLVVMSVAVGVFALGLVFAVADLMRARMTEAQLASLPSHLTFWLSPIDQDVVTVIRKEPGVQDAEATTAMNVRWKRDGEETWHNGVLVTRRSYAAQHMNRVDLVAGSWPTDRTVAIERLSARYYGVPFGATVILAVGNRELPLPVDGVVSDASAVPPQFGGDAQFYSTPDIRLRLTGDDLFDQLHVRLPEFSLTEAEEVAKSIRQRLENMGITINGHLVTDPTIHPLQSTLDTVFLILTIISALALGLSIFLIINTVHAIIAQQVWQIGIMKVLGATFWRVLRIYIVGVLLYGVFAVLLAVPSGVICAHELSRWLLGLINIEDVPFRIVEPAIHIQVIVGLSVPVVAALLPMISGARITPHQAISNYGLGADFGRGIFDGLITHLRGLPRPLALSIRNTFRRKTRASLTLITLVLGGLLFIVVMSVGTSLEKTVETLVRDLGMDVIVILQQPHRGVVVLPIVEDVPGVTKAEVWDRRQAMLVLANGQKREISLWGVPTDSSMVSPRIVAGRGLLLEDGPAIVLNKKIASEQNIQVGESVTLTIGSRDSTWTVVGIMLNVSNEQNDNYVPFKTLTREAGWSNRGSILAVDLDEQSPVSQETVMINLRTALSGRNINVAFTDSVGDLQQRSQAQFAVLMGLLLAMSLLVAAVGSLGLAGTMSINVVERSREIGVMRAIGATSAAIIRIVVGEGIFLALLSWVIAVPLSVPAARSFSTMVGYELLRVPLDFRFSSDSILLWLGIILVLSTFASLLPAQRASQISVRETLTYE